MASYATERKIRIIKEKLGENWKDKLEGRSIDAAYNELVGDSRKNLFCKIDPSAKARLDEMVEEFDVKMAELVESMINEEYEKLERKRDTSSVDLARQFAS